MYEDEVKWNKTKSEGKGPHRDYSYNLMKAKEFCAKVQKSLLEGMAAKVVDSEGLKEALLMISFQPPREAKMGNYAAPVFLHQDKSLVTQQTESVFNSYMALSKKFWDSRQLSLMPQEVPGMPYNRLSLEKGVDIAQNLKTA